MAFDFRFDVPRFIPRVWGKLIDHDAHDRAARFILDFGTLSKVEKME